LYESRERFDVIYNEVGDLEARNNMTTGIQGSTANASTQYRCDAGGESITPNLQLIFTRNECDVNRP
jgi:hypothetical protein